MSLLQAIVLGILQGATEFIPVSSSGHLVIAPWLLEWQLDPKASFVFDVLAHWGTLTALLVYFRRDLGALIRRFLQGLLTGKPWSDPWARTAWLIILGTLPAAILGHWTQDFFKQAFSKPIAASGFLLLTAAALSLGEFLSGKRTSRVHSPEETEPISGTNPDPQVLPPRGLLPGVAILIGFAQALALFPGISRSGITIAAGSALGLRRVDAARFSFLLAIPAMLGAGMLTLFDLFQSEELLQAAPSFLIGFIGAAAVGYAAIHWLLSYLNQGSLYRFAIYCLTLGSIGLILGGLRS